VDLTGDMHVLYKQRVDNAQHLKPRAKEYRQSTMDATCAWRIPAHAAMGSSKSPLQCDRHL
jgi:hypothetical protein